MTVRAKVALVGVVLVGVLVAAGTIAYLGDQPAKAKTPDRTTLVKQAARRFFAAANRNDAHAFCHSYSQVVVAESGKDYGLTMAQSYRQCEAAAGVPGALDEYHTTDVYIAPRVVFQPDGIGRVRLRIGGVWQFFYFHHDRDGVWRFVTAECISCGTPGGVRSGEVA